MLSYYVQKSMMEENYSNAFVGFFKLNEEIEKSIEDLNVIRKQYFYLIAKDILMIFLLRIVNFDMHRLHKNGKIE